MCPASKSAAIELCSMAEGTDDKGDAARLRWKGVFLELLGYFWDNYWELPRGMRLYIEELSTKKWPFRKE
jgi:hypothetical protein